MPTVLVELGVLSHKTDAERIGNPNYQARLAQAVSTGILNYFQTKN
jgi:N-acetylmuramoyl-L-alanine amidase